MSVRASFQIPFWTHLILNIETITPKIVLLFKQIIPLLAITLGSYFLGSAMLSFSKEASLLYGMIPSLLAGSITALSTLILQKLQTTPIPVLAEIGAIATNVTLVIKTLNSSLDPLQMSVGALGVSLLFEANSVMNKKVGIDAANAATCTSCLISLLAILPSNNPLLALLPTTLLIAKAIEFSFQLDNP